MKYIRLILLVILLSGCTQVNNKNISSELQDPSNKIHSGEIIELKRGKQIEEIETPKILYNTLSLQAIMQKKIEGSDLKLEQVLSQNSKYTRYRISYINGDLKLSGIMNIPVGTGPFPLLVLNHGYIDTRYYTNGRGLKREQDYFANNGFAVIHPDYRNHAFSDKVNEEPYDFRLGYITDVIASILAVKKSELKELSTIDSSRVGMLGHSMGGGISQSIAVSKPELIDALVLYGPVSNNEYTNFEKFQLSNPTRNTRVQKVLNDYQTPKENPDFWSGISSSTFFENIAVPIMIFTGTADKDTPTQWAQDIAQELRNLEKEVEIISYEGEGHEFGTGWSDFMKQSGEFFKKNLSGL